MLPPEASHQLAIRELLYTAVTRAKERATIWAKPEVLAATVARRSGRRSGLVEAYREGSR